MIAKPNQLVIEIENVHSEECGAPPGLRKTAGDSGYSGYFENDFGEQWLISINRETRTGTLYAGDISWNEPIRIKWHRPDGVFACEE